MRNYYQILGVAPGSTSEKIRKAYLRLIKRFHTDRNKSHDAEARCVELNIAYGVLGDIVERARYDQIYHFPAPQKSDKEADRYKSYFDIVMERRAKLTHYGGYALQEVLEAKPFSSKDLLGLIGSAANVLECGIPLGGNIKGLRLLVTITAPDLYHMLYRDLFVELATTGIPNMYTVYHGTFLGAQKAEQLTGLLALLHEHLPSGNYNAELRYSNWEGKKYTGAPCISSLEVGGYPLLHEGMLTLNGTLWRLEE